MYKMADYRWFLVSELLLAMEGSFLWLAVVYPHPPQLLSPNPPFNSLAYSPRASSPEEILGYHSSQIGTVRQAMILLLNHHLGSLWVIAYAFWGYSSVKPA